MNDPFLRSTTPSGDPNNSSNDNNNNRLLGSPEGRVSDLEQEVLDEYTRLLENVNKLSDALATLSDSPASPTLDGLRHLERKTATVYTLLKASVYSIVLQQQIINDDEVAAAATSSSNTGHDDGYHPNMEDASVMSSDHHIMHGHGHGV
ncbi:hypothetical protein UA08_08555 [Talaromyces atroroseus]|uniref:DASH complex subunit DAD3 n=1 Tax=Talaromyces atroroseus TaxID=1441469 RepID=A0A1Q5Q7W7_TALAT|nr:hypothetical protein UA08_08555 [Talaromyces atroroseus]OKL56303.1 hypothetical protein UA08_08555 [Talaromyces atroroseus]